MFGVLRRTGGFFKPSGIDRKCFGGFVYSGEVIQARRNGLPIVALETTIVTHGMPYPDNYATAVTVESVIRKKGAVPATIGIINGRIHVGLTEEQIKKLAVEAGGPQSAIKCSQRDICGVVAGRANGGTTVGGTVTIAKLAGIPVMATGGIGGVHRGAEETFDISSDLVVLGRTPVAVVCAGVKAILDIPKTLEFLETLGVPVVTMGDTETFPAFYSRSTSDYLKSPARVSGCQQAAECIKAQRDLGLNSGLVFAVPIPQSASLDPLEIEGFIQMALRESEEKKIRGKAVTPYLLKRITELTGGKSLAANKILIQNNAAVAAEISLHLSKLLNQNEENYANDVKRVIPGVPVVIGGAVEDTLLQCEDTPLKFDGRTHKGKSRKSYGGVGRNIAAALVALGVEGTKFLSVVGGDEAGRTIVRDLVGAGGTVRMLSGETTARYTAAVDGAGECRFAVGEMDIFDSIDVSLIHENRSALEQAQLIILDGNPPVDTIREVIDIAVNCQIPVWYEPTDVKKACKIFDAHSEWKKILHFVTPNVKELFAMAEYFSIKKMDHISPDGARELITDVAEKLAEYIPVVVATMGAEGVLIVRRGSKSDVFYSKNNNKLLLLENGGIQSRLYSPTPKIKEHSRESKYSVSGCGDCLAAGIISGILRGFTEESCVSLGLKAARLSLESTQTVPTSLRTLH
ncbi:pseudouridine-metabolizing bifunctional protein C1861.05 [Diachasma alloeum]|uniref:pseudouridine-metabolizing bifunctional protein C1861.05 n=1 Tax=Diachasma alloeum TaxID=454923 RepID=UPI0007384A67|nr:pseudouridine-metabolizing bifunctional protein C1861.05 [Diachasma alloeum]